MLLALLAILAILPATEGQGREASGTASEQEERERDGGRTPL